MVGRVMLHTCLMPTSLMKHSNCDIAFTDDLGYEHHLCGFLSGNRKNCLQLDNSNMAATLDVNAIRQQFPALHQEQIYFDNAGGSQTLKSVIDSYVSFMRLSPSNVR